MIPNNKVAKCKFRLAFIFNILFEFKYGEMWERRGIG